MVIYFVLFGNEISFVRKLDEIEDDWANPFKTRNLGYEIFKYISLTDSSAGS